MFSNDKVTAKPNFTVEVCFHFVNAEVLCGFRILPQIAPCGNVAFKMLFLRMHFYRHYLLHTANVLFQTMRHFV